MNKIFKYVVIAAAAFALIACEKTPQDNGKDPEKPGNETPKEEIEYTEDIQFTLEVLSVESEAAQIKVTHTGTNDDTWYGFATTSTNVRVSVEDMVEELTASGEEISGLCNLTSEIVKVQDLEPDTDYNYIVFAITKDGDLYGEYKSIRFKTPVAFGENAAWTVEYTARQTIGEHEYEHTVTVTSTDKNPYFMTVVTKDRFDGTDRKTLIEEELASFKEFIENYNAYYEVETTFKSWCYTGSAVDAFGLELGYTYVALAIGASSDGELTGHYAVSEEFEPYEEEMTPEYASWLGTWTLTGSNGVSFDVTFTKDKSNTSYIMTGWETDKFDVIVDWYPGDNFWIVWSQFIGTYTSAGYGDFDLYFAPANYVEKDQEVYTTDGLPICIGCDLSNGEKAVIGYAEDDKTLYTHMRFAGVWYDGVGGITATTDFPTFPLTVTPCASTLSAPSELATVSRKAVNMTPPARFKLYRF